MECVLVDGKKKLLLSEYVFFNRERLYFFTVSPPFFLSYTPPHFSLVPGFLKSLAGGFLLYLRKGAKRTMESFYFFLKVFGYTICISQMLGFIYTIRRREYDYSSI